MTPTYLNSPTYAFPAELKEDDQHLSPIPYVSSSSSVSCYVFGNSSTQDHSGSYHGEIQPPQNPQQVYNFASHGGSHEHSGSYEHGGETESGLKFSVVKEKAANENQIERNIEIKWMSSKMRLMKKMKKPDPTVEDNSSPIETDNCSNSSSNSSNHNPIRVCADCNTTKTPLWRGGPRGPKSLCNACGIRQRKARRAMAAAANGTILPTKTSPNKITKVKHKDKRSSSGQVSKCKNSSKLVSNGNANKNRIEDFLLNLSKNLAFHRVFPQDEKEAAILLMALSCGHVHG